ncbi:Purine ribonucleoside efflux pump NepI [Klebsiella pneumoniae]|nr:Purine ribonucleoside efflux pump NepI [Klebsiella pneumoniae]
MKSPRAPQRQGSVLRLFRLSTLSGIAGLRTVLYGTVYLIYLCATVSGDGDPVSPSGLPLILLAIGIAGFVGCDRSECPILSDADSYPFGHGRDCRNASAGRTAHGIGHRTVKPVGPAGDSGTGWWTWIARTLPEDAETGGGLMVAVIQLSIALGSTVGGLVFDSLGWHSTFALSGLLLLGAAGVTFLLSVKIRSYQRTAINELNA